MQLAISCGMEIISPLRGICSTYKTLEFCLVVHLITYNPSWLCLNHCITMTKVSVSTTELWFAGLSLISVTSCMSSGTRLIQGF